MDAGSQLAQGHSDGARRRADRQRLCGQRRPPYGQGCGVRLAARGNIPAALDGLIDILRQDRHYRDDIARKVALGLLELLGEENPLTRQYRSELASVLF